MRFKYYLRGCGLGILFTAVVLMICFHNKRTVGISDEEVIARASALGMVPKESKEQDTSKDGHRDTESSENPEGVKETEETKDSQGQKETEETPQTTPQNPTNSGQTPDEEPSNGRELTPAVILDDGSVMITVKAGDVCRDIAAELYRAGIVQDAEKFRQYMQDSGADVQVKSGEFVFTKGMDYRQILEILTKR